MNQTLINEAHGKVFHVPGVINGCAKVRFMGIWPSGNVAVKRAADPDSFGPLTVSPEKAKPLLDTIEASYAKN